MNQQPSHDLIPSAVGAASVVTELTEAEATRDITQAVGARHSIARNYVRWLRRRNPRATPAEIIRTLEKHYATSITTAGAMMAAGAIAVDVGIAMIPVAGAAAAGAKSAGQQAAKQTAKEATKRAAQLAAKNVALGAAKSGARRGAALLPAGDEQLQFEITAIFGLALAEIHGMSLDKAQAHALVYGLSNERVSPQLLAQMARDLTEEQPEGVVGVGSRIAAGREDWSHWAATLAAALPGAGAQRFLRTMQTGKLEGMRENLSGRQRATVEYGIGAVAGGVTRFVFGREVISASRAAFANPPEEFPEHLRETRAPKRMKPASNPEGARALALLQGAARATGSWVAGTASTIGGGISSGATAMGAAVGSGASAVATRAGSAFRKRGRGGHPDDWTAYDPQSQLPEPENSGSSTDTPEPPLTDGP